MLRSWPSFSGLPEPGFMGEAGAVFLSGSGSFSYSYSTVNMLFLLDPQVILTLIVF